MAMPAGLTEDRAAKRIRMPDDAREKALAFFAAFLARFRAFSGLAQKLTDGNEGFTYASPSLVAAVEARKTGTLLKRASSLRSFLTWFGRTAKEDKALFSEPTLFEYVGYLNDRRAGATVGKAFLQTVNFAGGALR